MAKLINHLTMGRPAEVLVHFDLAFAIIILEINANLKFPHF